MEKDNFEEVFKRLFLSTNPWTKHIQIECSLYMFVIFSMNHPWKWIQTCKVFHWKPLHHETDIISVEIYKVHVFWNFFKRTLIQGVITTNIQILSLLPHEFLLDVFLLLSNSDPLSHTCTWRCHIYIIVYDGETFVYAVFFSFHDNYKKYL